MIETKNYAGEIDMTDEKPWIQTIPTRERRACSNAYYQSVTHFNIMRNLANYRHLKKRRLVSRRSIGDNGIEKCLPKSAYMGVADSTL